MSDHELFYQVDRRKVEEAMRRARRERSIAVSEFLKRIFGRKGRGEAATHASGCADLAGRAAAH